MADEERTRRVRDALDKEQTRLVRRPHDETTGLVQDIATKRTEAVKTQLLRRPKGKSSPDEKPGEYEFESERLVAGWLVVIEGPGRGSFAPVYDGMNSVGRGDDQATQLDFGDDTISRSEHAFITYDFKSRKFYIQHGGKANVVRLNDAPVLQPMELHSGDTMSLGRTVVRFVAFCGENFDWQE